MVLPVQRQRMMKTPLPVNNGAKSSPFAALYNMYGVLAMD
jgi:hypothetical protein